MEVPLNNSGNAFAGAKISTRVPEFWQKTEVRPDIQVTATNIRKWIVTVCHRKKCEGADFDESEGPCATQTGSLNQTTYGTI